MTFPERKARFDQNNPVRESAILAFDGVEGYDVYNCSIPFWWKGVRYIYGRVERRAEWARSWVRLFQETGPDAFTLVPGSMVYQLEDPFVSVIHGELVLGGTHVRYAQNQIDTYMGYFYKGADIADLQYFTTGPGGMKDIRLVELQNGVGVFSRPRGEQVRREHGSASIVGFTVIPDLLSLSAEAVQRAPKVHGLFARGEWGGCNQCYLLESGYIGIIGHKSYPQIGGGGQPLSVYVNVSFVLDPQNNTILDEKILATRKSYPPAPAKVPDLQDCVFASGITLREDGRMDLYSGLGDTCQGRAVIDDPFAGFGKIISSPR
ncbi:MAG: DUF1861 family protein [Clostridia bacterium]|nr:DUF1861 family protein [Clostridia bacterium]